MRNIKTEKISRRRFLRSSAAGLAMLGAAPLCFSAAGEKKSRLDTIKGSKPNIIFVLTDDMGYNNLGFLGNTKLKTPSLDRMAAEGMFFSNHYAGSTVCAPSRATLLTGKHTGHVYQRGNGREAGVIEFRPDPLDITIATRLKAAGYHTAMIGKSGVACNSDNAELPNQKGFDHFFGFLAHAAAHRYYPTELTRNGKTIHYPQNNGHTGEVYSGDLILDDALGYIGKRSKTGLPFFLHLALQQPHADLSAPEEFRQPFINRFDEEPQRFGGYLPQSKPAATYAAMILYIDHTIRRLFQKLRELGIEENTLVIFSSDNGSYSEGGYHYQMHNSNAPFRGGKRDLYEGGIHVPMIAWWQGRIEGGARSEHISAFWDFAPTALELAGLPVPDDMDGISYLPTLLGKRQQQKQHKYLYWEFYEQGGKQAVRYGDWKGVRLDVQQNRQNPIELYNLAQDAGEQNNLAKSHPEIVKKIADFMQEAHETPEFEGFYF